MITQSRAICVLAGGAIAIFDVNAGKLIHIIESGGKPVRNILLTSDTMKAIHSTDDTLTFWDLRNGQTIHSLEGHTKYIKDFEITSNNSRVISVSDNETILWDLYKGSKLQHIQSNSTPVTINKNFVGLGKKLFKMEDWQSIILNIPHKPITIQAPNNLLDVKQAGSLTVLYKLCYTKQKR